MKAHRRKAIRDLCVTWAFVLGGIAVLFALLLIGVIR
jgi:hypothetical protein